MSIDLHIHTTASDGVYSPEKVVKLAENRGLKGFSITDHDTVSGIEPALRTVRRIRFVPGIEITTETSEEEIHLLGYYINYQSPVLLEFLAEFREARRNRLAKMLSRLGELGYELNDSSLSELENPGRMHVARALVKAGLVNDREEAFARLLEKGRPAYVPRFKISPEEGVDLILRAGGLPVLAHPVDIEDLNWISRLKERGLIGIEAYHPRHEPMFTEHLLAIAREKGLLVTGGSDCHGPIYNGRDLLGSLRVPEKCLDDLYKMKEART